jgi:hypothetical protein
MPRSLVTDLAIRKWVRDRFGFHPEASWIAHFKRLCGLQLDDVRAYQSRVNPCPLERQPAIMKAFRHFGLISADSQPDSISPRMHRRDVM